MFGRRTLAYPPSMTSYEAAMEVYDSIKPVRGREPNERPLADRRDWSLTIRRGLDGSVRVRHHRTYIVTYRPDGYIDVVPYPSKTTQGIVAELIRSLGLRPAWSSLIPVTKLNGVYYHTPDEFTITPDGRLEGAVPVDIRSVDRKAANAIYREHRLNEFALWIRSIYRMRLADTVVYTGYGRSSRWALGNHEAVDYLTRGEDGWRELVSNYGAGGPEEYIDVCRAALIRVYEPFAVTTTDRFQSYKEWQAAVRAKGKWW